MIDKAAVAGAARLGIGAVCFGQLRCCAVRKGADRGRKAEPASHSGAAECSA